MYSESATDSSLPQHFRASYAEDLVKNETPIPDFTRPSHFATRKLNPSHGFLLFSQFREDGIMRFGLRF